MLTNEEQFHYFDAFPVSGSPHNSTSATQTSTIKLIQFYGPKRRAGNVENIRPRYFVSTFHTTNYSIRAKSDEKSYKMSRGA